MRAFLGIDFSEETKAAISQLQNELRGRAVKGRWKYVENFHLTMKFFEEISDAQKSDIDIAAREVCGRMEGFQLCLGNLGVFKGRDHVRVLWIGLDGETRKLDNLYEALEMELHVHGFAKERRAFKPHVTIGQDLVFRCPLDQLSKYGVTDFKEINVERLTLFKSEQIGSNRVYTKIEEYLLKQKKYQG